MWAKQNVSICQTWSKDSQIGTLLLMVQFQVSREVTSDLKHVLYLIPLHWKPNRVFAISKTSLLRCKINLVGEHIEHSSHINYLDYAISLYPFKEWKEGKVVEVGGHMAVQWHEYPEIFALTFTSCFNFKEISSWVFTFPYL